MSDSDNYSNSDDDDMYCQQTQPKFLESPPSSPPPIRKKTARLTDNDDTTLLHTMPTTETHGGSGLLLNTRNSTQSKNVSTKQKMSLLRPLPKLPGSPRTITEEDQKKIMQIEIKVKQEMQAFRRFKGVTKLIKSCIGDNAEVIFQQGVDHYTTHGTLNQYFLSMAKAIDGRETGQWNSEITACIQQHAMEIAEELADQAGWASRVHEANKRREEMARAMNPTM